MIIGLSGRKRSGKDTTAALLTKELGFRRLAFVDKLKELAVGVSLTEVQTDAFKEKLIFGGIDGLDWTGRDVLQRLGVAAREVFGEDFWVKQSVQGAIAQARPLVFTDARFWNELEAVRAAGGLIVRVNRADRVGRHEYEGGGWGDKHGDTGACQEINGQGNVCGLPRASHPSHFSGDTHPSETTLPDSGGRYDLVVESGSAEETAAQVLAWVKERIS